MIQEKFPAAVDYQTENTRMENQGNALSCTTFGGTSAIEPMLHRLGKPWQISARFIWFNMRSTNPSVASMAQALETHGACLDEYCPYVTEPDFPFNVVGIYDPPSAQAWKDAETRLPKGVKPAQITTGKEGVMRALAQGSCITAIKVGGPTEHCVAIIGYNDFGVKVHDSGNNIYWQPWSDIESGGVITQLYRWEGLDLVPHPDYVKEETPTLEDGVLSLAKVFVWIGWASNPKSITFKNVKLQMVNQGWLSHDCDDVQDIAFWHSRELTLYLPELIVDGKLMRKVKIVGPTATAISLEEA